MKRYEVIENLERRFGDVFNGEAINLTQATDEVMVLLENGKHIKDIRLAMSGKLLIVGFMR